MIMLEQIHLAGKLPAVKFFHSQFSYMLDVINDKDRIGLYSWNVVFTETFPNMLLRRSSREKKTLYSTLNMSTLEHAVIMDEDLKYVVYFKCVTDSYQLFRIPSTSSTITYIYCILVNT